MEHPITEPGCHGRMAGVSGLNPSAQTTPPPRPNSGSLPRSLGYWCAQLDSTVSATDMTVEEPDCTILACVHQRHR